MAEQEKQDGFLMNVPREDKRSLSAYKEIFKLTTELSTGRKILTVLRFEVTSVKSPLITITVRITAIRGTPVRN